MVPASWGLDVTHRDMIKAGAVMAQATYGGVTYRDVVDFPWDDYQDLVAFLKDREPKDREQ